MKVYERRQSEIHMLESKIEELATELRNNLEELEGVVRDLWEHDEEYISPNGESLDYYDVSDLADRVGDIEDMFES